LICRPIRVIESDWGIRHGVAVPQQVLATGEKPMSINTCVRVVILDLMDDPITVGIFNLTTT
jgi:hypothetical protein